LRYFVVAPDGQRYGPASVQTLQQWAIERRLDANTTLIEEGSFRQFRAGDLVPMPTAQSGTPYMPQQGYNAPPQASQTPYAPGYVQNIPGGQYPANAYQTGSGFVVISFMCSFLALFLMCTFPVGLIFALLGIGFGQAAKNRNQPSAKAAFTLAAVMLGVNLFTQVIWPYIY